MENIKFENSKVLKLAKVNKLQIEQKAIFSVLTECVNISEPIKASLVIAFDKISKTIDELQNEINS